MTTNRVLAAALALALVAAPGVEGLARAEDPKRFFNVGELAVSGEVRNTLAADINDDGLDDLLVTHVVYDEAARRITKFVSIFPHRAAGFAPTPDDTMELPADAVAIDLGNAIVEAPPAPVHSDSAGGVQIDIGSPTPRARTLEMIVARASGLFAYPIAGGKIARTGVRLAANDS
ncbi:MAG: hypothetical protein KC466_07680, partial [Myxococcales bacterium]|nr:hypothetical protein [Myxococcales bacterium]